VHSLAMHIGADSLTVTLTLTLDLLNPKLIGFDIVSMTKPTIVCQVSSHSDNEL